MGSRTAAWLIGVSASFAVVSFGVMVVFFAQPWRTCPDDDVAAACPALPQDAAVMTVAGVVTLLSLLLLVVGLAARSQSALPTPVGRSRRRMVALWGAAGCAVGILALAFLAGYWPW